MCAGYRRWLRPNGGRCGPGPTSQFDNRARVTGVSGFRLVIDDDFIKRQNAVIEQRIAGFRQPFAKPGS